ncbi:MAG TPA: magnesium transporter, partial [Actinomycetota bacterium]|nr:magnesium transporter [Actinomycetota bacterium]
MRLPKGLPAVGRVIGYWRAERRTIRHGLISLVGATAAEVAAGVALGAITGTLERVPGLLVLLPAANSIRGSIFGALSSRLGTSIHTGTFEPSRNRESMLYQNIYSATVLTLSVSFALGLLAKGVAAGLGLPSVSVLDLVVISVLGGVVSSAIVGAMSVVLALAAHSYGWDLDSVATPAITAIGDLVTIPALFAATYAVGTPWVTAIVAGAIAVLTLAMTIRGLTSRLPEARRAVRESLPVLAATGTLSLLAGVVVEHRIERFIAFPALLILIPPLLSDTGALAASLSSRLASKLHLGALEPKGLPQGLALLDTSIFLLFGLWVFVLVAVTAHFAALALGLASPGLGSMIGVGVVAGVVATLVLVILGYYVAIATYRLGLDPDNHGIP